MSEELKLCENEDIKDKAREICKRYLGGIWESVKTSDIRLRILQGGLANDLYHCSIIYKSTNNGEREEALLRIFGSHRNIDKLERPLLNENVVLMKLSERRLAPKIYGVFAEGRLEEFIQGRTLKIEELLYPQIAAAIARKIAMIHSLEMPISKHPYTHYSTFLRHLKYARKEISFEQMENKDRKLAEFIFSHDLEGEFEWLTNLLSTSNSPIVFCHNDVRDANILLSDDEKMNLDDRITLLDYEYASYNYRGFEFAKIFCRLCVEFTAIPPNFKITKENFPTIEQQLLYIDAYLSCLKQYPHMNNERNTREQLLEELFLFLPAQHLFAALFCTVVAFTSKLKFSFWEYCKARLELYFEEKQKVIEKLRESSSSDQINGHENGIM